MEQQTTLERLCMRPPPLLLLLLLLRVLLPVLLLPLMKMIAVLLMGMLAGQPNVLAVAHLVPHQQSSSSSSRVWRACQQHQHQRGQLACSLLVAGR
jgi:hypothetical protein